MSETTPSKAVLTQRWHELPAGTRLDVLRETGGLWEGCYEVAREDGKVIPQPFAGSQLTVIIAAGPWLKFI